MTASLGYVLSQLQRWTSPHLGELSDALLLERFVQRRDESAFAALVARHGGMVLRSCRRILGDAHRAEDAFQAVFLILARQAHTLRQAAALPAYLHKIARRVALKARSKSVARGNDTPLTEHLPDRRSDPLAQLTVRELLEILDEEVSRLPAAQRSAVVMCCLEGRTRQEAARILDWTAGSLKGHLERGRRRLQTRLLKRGIALPAALAIVAATRGEGVPALLLRSTVTAALHGGIGGSAAALAQPVLKTMFLTKLAGMMAVVMTVAFAASATVAVVYRGPGERRGVSPPVQSHRRADAAPLARDVLGEPLPDGAIARLGSQRFRHTENIARISFTPDGKRVVSQGMDGVRFWDVATGKELRRIAPKAGQFWVGGDLSPDGKWLVGKDTKPNPSYTGPLELWDAQNGRKVADVGEGYCDNACFSSDGKLLAFTSKKDNLCIYDLKSKRELRSWPGNIKQVLSIAFSADSRQLLVRERTGLVRLWDVATGRQLQEFSVGRPVSREYTALSPDGKLVALIEDNERRTPAAGKVEWKARISLRDAATGKQVRLLTCAAKELAPGFALPFASVLFRRDGKKLLTSGPDQFLREWDVAAGEELRRIELPGGLPYALFALSRDEKQLAAVMIGAALSNDKMPRAIRIIDLADGKMREEPAGHQASVGLAILAPDGRTAITGYFPDSAVIWDADKGTVRRRFDNQGLPLFGLSLSADGRTLFSTSTDNNIRVWDMETGKQRRTMKVSQGSATNIYGLVVSRDSKTIALVALQSGGRSIRVLDGETGQQRQQFQAPNTIRSLSLSADGRWLVGWGLDHKVQVWDLAAGVKRHEYALPEPPVPPGVLTRYRAAASPDGRLFAACTQRVRTAKNVVSEHLLIVKDLATGRDIHRIHNPPSDFGALAFSPDGRTLAYSGTFDATIRFVEVASGKERHRLAGLQGQAMALSFSARGDRLISGCADTTALIWDLGLRPAPRPATAEELMKLWADLADADAARAYQAIRKLAASPSSAIPFIRKNLSAAAPVDAKRLARLIADLDSDDFATRQKSTEEMEKLDERAAPHFQKALEGKPSLEVRRRLENLLDKAQRAWWDVSGERLRSLRAVEALELAGDKEARKLLKTLADGAAGARPTEEAKASLQRMAKPARN